MGTVVRLLSLLLVCVCSTFTRALAPSDSFRDADLGQTGYAGGDHNIDPSTASQFKQLWNVTFKPDEKVGLHSGLSSPAET